MRYGCANMRSVCNKASVVNDHITQHDLDLFLITETWMNGTNMNRVEAEMLPEGYSLVHRMRSEKKGGGIALIHSDNIAVQTVRSPQSPSTFESLEVQITREGTSFHLIGIYRPPSLATDVTVFHEEFADLLSHHACSPSQVLLMGDFNIHWEKESNPDAKKLRSALQEASFVQHVTQLMQHTWRGTQLTWSFPKWIVTSSNQSPYLNSFPTTSLFTEHSTRKKPRGGVRKSPIDVLSALITKYLEGNLSKCKPS